MRGQWIERRGVDNRWCRGGSQREDVAGAGRMGWACEDEVWTQLSPRHPPRLDIKNLIDDKQRLMTKKTRPDNQGQSKVQNFLNRRSGFEKLS